MLGRAVGGYTSVPSQRQLQQIQKNSEQLKALVERLNKIIEEAVPRLNKLMNENNIPHVIPGEKIKIKE
jgi:coenzyme F420-reducing hydrogenase alpha subunit